VHLAFILKVDSRPILNEAGYSNRIIKQSHFSFKLKSVFISTAKTAILLICSRAVVLWGLF